MDFTAATSPKTGNSANAAPGSSLLSFMSAASNDIKEAMAKQSKRKVNPRNYIKKRVKRLNNPAPTGKPTKAKANKMASVKTLRGLTSSLSSATFGQRSTSWPLLPQPAEPRVYHGQHRASLPTSELEGTRHTLYPAHAQKAMAIDSDLEKVLDVVDELESRSSSPQQDSSDSVYSQQALLGEYPFSGSPYSECSDELFEDCYSSSCSPSSGVGYADSPPTATSTNDWVPSGPSQPVSSSNSNWAEPSQTVYTTYAQGIVNTTAPWPATSSAVLPLSTSLPCATYSYDQNLPLTPTVSELWNSLAFGENF